MFICDRCKSEITSLRFPGQMPNYNQDYCSLPQVNFILCLPCWNQYIDGSEKIESEIKKLKASRHENWLNEFKSNCKVKGESK